MLCFNIHNIVMLTIPLGANTVLRTFSNRFDTVKTRMQCTPPGIYRGAFDVLTKVVTKEVSLLQFYVSRHAELTFREYLHCTKEPHLPLWDGLQ